MFYHHHTRSEWIGEECNCLFNYVGDIRLGRYIKPVDLDIFKQTLLTWFHQFRSDLKQTPRNRQALVDVSSEWSMCNLTLWGKGLFFGANMVNFFFFSDWAQFFYTKPYIQSIQPSIIVRFKRWKFWWLQENVCILRINDNIRDYGNIYDIINVGEEKQRTEYCSLRNSVFYFSCLSCTELTSCELTRQSTNPIHFSFTYDVMLDSVKSFSKYYKNTDRIQLFLEFWQ